MSFTRNHQTVVFVRGDNAYSPEYWNRATRLQDSLNRDDTMKADFITVGNNGYARQGVIAPWVNSTQDPVPFFPGSSNLRQWSQDMGYVACMILSPASNEISNFGDLDAGNDEYVSPVDYDRFAETDEYEDEEMSIPDSLREIYISTFNLYDHDDVPFEPAPHGELGSEVGETPASTVTLDLSEDQVNLLTDILAIAKGKV